jgi:hypothetical protein
MDTARDTNTLDVAQFQGFTCPTEPAGPRRYTVKDVDQAVADMIKDGHPEPSNRREMRQLKALAKKALRKAGR